MFKGGVPIPFLDPDFMGFESVSVSSPKPILNIKMFFYLLDIGASAVTIAFTNIDKAAWLNWTRIKG